jgi:acetyl esterase/lipase
LAVRRRKIEKAGGNEFHDLEQVMMKVRTIEDIDYSNGFAVDDGRRHRQLDLFLPESDRPAPPIVVIHGGGWFTQGRKGARERNIATDLASAGFAAASIDYALVNLDSPEKSHGLWPTPLNDCKMAVGFLRKHADEYQIAPERAGAIGGSAGAHLAAMLGASSGNNSIDSAFGLDCTVQAVAYLYGVCDIGRWIANADEHRLGMDAAEIMLDGTPASNPEAYESASPVCQISSQSAPMLLIHGKADAAIPYGETEYFYNRAQEAGLESELILVPDAGHSFDLNPPSMDIKNRVISFFHKHLAGEIG